jgi:chorismate mutase
MSAADEIRDLLCSDDPADHERARQLAQRDGELLALLDEHDQLAAAVTAWKTQPQAPAALRERILAQIRESDASPRGHAHAPVIGIERSPRFTSRLWTWQGQRAPRSMSRS